MVLPVPSRANGMPVCSMLCQALMTMPCFYGEEKEGGS